MTNIKDENEFQKKYLRYNNLKMIDDSVDWIVYKYFYSLRSNSVYYIWTLYKPN